MEQGDAAAAVGPLAEAVRISPGGREFKTAATWPAEPAPLQTPLGLEMAKVPQETIDRYGDVGAFSSVAVDAGRAHFVYQGENALWHASVMPTFWQE